ncbi:cell division protein FtsZ [Evansella vedderi]|uniref:Cell division protein FtsZ n=1 Tax=Evansella vedderi TaxID=38282 RepID=A0ABT9ZW03_9BACI|nr:cell division protein FtsZ [Evansella vedderi]MDQ0255140.1 cell division protein FtsZ [Evansella vedderi]
MDNSITIYEIKQELNEEDLEYLLKMERENICFFRFVGGNPSETEELLKNLYRLKESDILLFIIFRFPFRFEGKSRMETAIKQYFQLKDICDGMIYFYSDGMMDMLEENTSIRQANQQFEKFEQAPIQAIREMLHQTGDINIDVHDLKTFITNKKGSLFIRTFEGESFDEPLKYLISAPYLPTDFAEGNQIIINIGYSQDVDMEAFRQINLRLNDLFHKAEIFKLGSYLINEPGSRLKITLIANGISDPFTRPEKMKHVPFYKYWIMQKWEKFTQINIPGHFKTLTALNKKEH